MPPDPTPPADLPQLPAQLKGVLDAALDCIVTIDTANRIIEFNPAAERTFGYTRAHALGRDMADLIIPPAMRDRHRAGLAHMVATGTGKGMVGRRIEVHAMRADGTEFPVELTITKVTAGADTFFTAYLREDIVARLQTRFTAILDAALDCIITIDHAGRIVDFNAAATRTFGYAREQAVGREMGELIVPPAMRERHRLGLKRMVETGRSAGIIGQRIEITALHADGHEFPVELAITQIDSTGKEPFFTAYLRDLTERRRAEAAQRESQNYFEKSFHSSPALMSIASAVDGRLIEINPAFERGSGYPRAEALGKTTLELGLWLRPEQRDEFLRRIHTDRVIRDLEADFRSKTGAVRTLLLNADIIELGGRPCMLTVGIDISERRRRDQVQAATYEISQAVLGGDDLPALLAKVHHIIGGLISAKNFYVALLNADRSILSFPYFVDELSPQPAPRPPRHGITEFVMETREPLLGTYGEISARIARAGTYTPSGHPSAQWLGAPLIIDGRGIGVIAVQDYHNPHAYTEEDKRLLVFVAEQTAAAIHRQQVEAAQREARAYFEKSFHSSPALMVINRLSDRRITEANPAFLRACGFSREEVIGRTPDEINLWVNLAQRDAFLAGIRDRGAVRDLESEFRAKSGKTSTFLINADVIELGGTPSLLAVGIDISERRRREQIQSATYAISQAVLGGGDLPALFAEVHRIIAELMPAKNFYVALLSPDGGRLAFPYFADEIITWPRSRHLRNGFTEYILRTAQPLLITRDALVALLKTQGEFEALPHPAAQRLGAPLLLGGRAIGVIALQSYDRTDAYDENDLRLLEFVAGQTAAAVHRHEAAAALARAEARYRSIFENAVEGLYVSSPEGKFLSVNPALARMLGYDSPAALLTAVNDIKHQLYVRSGRRDDFFALIQHSDEIADFESEVLRRDGTTIWVSESVRVVRNAAGAIDHFEGVAADITQRREAARALQAAKEAADAASRSKSYFLASVSHELRTPLNGILGYTQILRRDNGLTDKQREGVRVIHESADHLLALINDVLDLSKIEAGRIELHPADFDLPDFATGVERVFTPRARDKSLLFETALATDLPRFTHGDEQRLRQIVFNLVANAVKFTTTGGVVFSVQRGAGEAIRFSVSDTGPGISEDDIKKLFEPFTQVGRQTAAATGTGLGLAISRSLVERMGGKLKVESKPGWGSRFWFEVSLPVATTSPARGSAAPMATRRVLGYEGVRRRVLIVDDNATNRAVMVDMLAPLGFELSEADDGESSLTLAASFKPDLVLMDLRLPGGIDGLEATRRLRKTALGAAMKIIAVSASAYDLDRNECLAAGCDAFLAKPFREEELWTLVERTLGLVWRLAEGEETRTPFPLAVHAPPAADADAIYELAAKGDVVGIRARAQALIERDAKLAPFAQNVLDLAARFKMKAIRQFAARYGTRPAP
jgi:PAS domain S-box-containing protein